MFGWFKQNPEEKCARAFYGLMNAYPYKSEKREVVWGLEMAVLRGGGDCDDKADLVYNALKANGLKPRIVHGSFSGVRHAAVLCRIGKTLYVFCNATGRVTTGDRYLGSKLTDYNILSDESYAAWKAKYGLNNILAKEGK
jgi:transglutaminase-like putative cysteine protease